MSTISRHARKATSANRVINSPAMQDAVLNKAGGLAFILPDSAQKLIFITGQFIGEPKYYDNFEVTPYAAGAQSPSGTPQERQHALDSKMASLGILDWAVPVLDSNTKEVVQTAFAVANSDQPRDLLVIAHWLRQEMNMRLSPALFLTIAARHEKTKCYVRQYCSKVLTRLDDIYNVVMFWNLLFQGRLPACLTRGLADALSHQNDYAIMKYGFRAEHPNLKDLLQIVDRRAGYPFDKEINDYVMSGKVPTSHPQIVAWDALLKKVSFDDEAKALAKTAKITWEDLSSKFATTPEGKKAVWSFLVEQGMPYMGLMRNLRNIMESGVPDHLMEKAAAALCDPDAVRKSRQMPFRYLAAYNAVKDADASPFVKEVIFWALDRALMISALDMPSLPGKTAIFADNSGSMVNRVSKESTIRNCDVANLLTAIVVKRCDENIAGAFGTDVSYVHARGRSAFDICTAIDSADTKGMDTNGYRIPQDLMRKGIFVDRLIVFTDCELWNDTAPNDWRQTFEQYQMSTVWKAYAKAMKAVVGKEPVLHLINLAGTTTTPVKPSANVHLLGGFTDKLIRLMAVAEGLVGADPETGEKTTVIQDLRLRF